MAVPASRRTAPQGALVLVALVALAGVLVWGGVAMPIAVLAWGAVAVPAVVLLAWMKYGSPPLDTVAAADTLVRYRYLFEQMPVATAQVDTQYRIVTCNAALRVLFDDVASHDDGPEGRLLLELVAQEYRDALGAHLAELATEGGADSALVVSLTNDAEHVVSINGGRITQDGSIIVTLIDTTRLMMLEQQVAQSQKMQAMGQLAGGIAHDFNNLLTAMIGFCDLLLQRHRAGDQSFADIMQIKQNANRAARLVRQLLAFSRQQILEPRLLSVTDVLAELANLLSRLLGERVELKMVHGRDLGLIKVDQGQLDQVVINLAVNARDAMAKGGALTIRTERVQLKTPIRAHGQEVIPGDYVTISVRDTGSGISAENLERIFDPFFTTKEVGAGTGLGLSTVYGIVKQTGGYILVESGGGAKGACFTIYFKRYERELDESEADPQNADARRDLTGGGTVILVEDEDPVRLFSARALRSKGYTVIEARNGEAALELIASEDFDLLITDMVMPKVDGAAVIREVRRTRTDIPVICISGYAEESVLQEVEAIKNVYFLPKPFSLQQLAGKVKEALEGRRT
jgi:two-component system cell cycle sensor histidine kinase/response regulator CckA